MILLATIIHWLRGWGNDAKSWSYWKNLATSKGATSFYLFALLWAYSGDWVWPLFTGLVYWAATFWYDKGELLSFLGNSDNGHTQDTGKIAYWIATKPLRRLPIPWEYKYGIAASLPYCLAMAPWGMPLFPMLYGVIYKHAPSDEIGRALFGLCLGLTFIL